ncbi:MAG TPA: UbiA prenyltransferase family protein [Kofleriaceae bacterium]|nr:UbiA prenyltransferase family protein [Kofleriaceae bacterium]
MTSRARALVRTMRPRQWVKNAFVGAPLVFSRQLEDPAALGRAALAVLAFCALSGAVYAFNDVHDAEADRLHPTKCNRPVAAGELSETGALVWSAVLAVGALAGCCALSWPLAGFAALYLVQNLVYSLGLKKLAFIDVGLIATGFLLRVLAGAAAIDVRASRWLLLCTALLATFLGLGKRGHELVWARRTGTTATRAALAGYRLDVVRAAMIGLGAVTCAAFVAYTLQPHTIEFFGGSQLVYVAPFVLLGVVRFLMLSLWRESNASPTDAMLSDPWFLVDLAAATATTLYLIYLR